MQAKILAMSKMDFPEETKWINVVLVARPHTMPRDMYIDYLALDLCNCPEMSHYKQRQKVTLNFLREEGGSKVYGKKLLCVQAANAIGK